MFENLSEPLLVARNIKLYTGTGNPELARKVADILHLELQGLLLEKFTLALTSLSAATRSSSFSLWQASTSTTWLWKR